MAKLGGLNMFIAYYYQNHMQARKARSHPAEFFYFFLFSPTMP